MKSLLLTAVLLLPLASQALECFGVNTYVTSDSEATLAWKPLKANFESENLYNAYVVDGSCTFTINYAKANGNTYYVSIVDSDTNASLSTLAAFDDKGKLQFSFNKAQSSTVCSMKCTK